MLEKTLDSYAADRHPKTDASSAIGNQDVLDSCPQNGAAIRAPIHNGESHEQGGAALSHLMTELQTRYDLRTCATLFLVGADRATLGQLASMLNDKHSVEVVGQATIGIDAIAQIAELKPDVVLLDIGLSVTNHRRTIQLIRATSPATQVLVLAMDSVPGHVLHTYWCGAHGYVLKDSDSHEIADAIYAIRNGRHYLDKRIELPNRRTR